METCSVVLTFESVDKILWWDHSNETSLAVLLHGTICFSISYKMKFSIFPKFWHSWVVKGIIVSQTIFNLEESDSLGCNGHHIR